MVRKKEIIRGHWTRFLLLLRIQRFGQSRPRGAVRCVASAALTDERDIGCVTCKAKRLKCDESKPTCQQCHKRNVDCGGYKKDFKWRSFEEATFASKPSPASTRGKKRE